MFGDRYRAAVAHHSAASGRAMDASTVADAARETSARSATYEALQHPRFQKTLPTLRIRSASRLRNAEFCGFYPKRQTFRFGIFCRSATSPKTLSPRHHAGRLASNLRFASPKIPAVRSVAEGRAELINSVGGRHHKAFSFHGGAHVLTAQRSAWCRFWKRDPLTSADGRNQGPAGWAGAPQPSTRAAAVLSAVGCPLTGDDSDA